MFVTDDPPPARPARRRWLLAAVGLVAAGWAGVAGYAVYWKLMGEGRYLERLASDDRPLTDAEFDYAMERIDSPYVAIGPPARRAAVRGCPGRPDRESRLVAAVAPWLDAANPYRRSQGLFALFGVARRRPADDPLRRQVVAVAAGLLDDPSGQRIVGVQLVGHFGAVEHLPKLRRLQAAATDPTERRLLAEAVARLEAGP